MKKAAKLTIAAFTAVTLSGAVSYRDYRDHLSCVHCRGFRYVDAKSVFGVHFSYVERYEEGPFIRSRTPHAHEWWLYSRHVTQCLSKTFECRTHRFADGVDFEKEEPNKAPEPTTGTVTPRATP
jgi:hypothetical protein